MEELRPLIVEAQAGDLEAFGRIVRRFQDMAYGYGYSILGDFQLAEDAAQEAFIEAYRDLPNLREPAAFSSWFRKIVFKRCDRITRRKKIPTVPLDDAVGFASADPGPADVAEEHEIREKVLEAIRALPDNERVVTTLFYINGYAHDEIAEFLEVPVTTVKSRLHTSRKRLKERMIGMVSDSLQEHALPQNFASRVISGIPALGWGKSKECSFAGALESALSVTSLPYDYHTIMGVTGLAFRVRWWQPREGIGWCPSSPVGEFPEEIEAAGKATGWQLGCESLLDQEKPEMERFAPDIVASVNAGRPVLAYDAEYNMCVIQGYEDGGKTVLMRQYWKPEEVVRRAISDLPGFLIFLNPGPKALSPRDALEQGLRIAVRNWHRSDGPDPNEKGYYLYGRAALEKWSHDLGLFDELSEKEREILFFVSWWNFTSLEDARAAAVKFLHDGARLLEAEPRKALDRAAEIYQRESALLSRAKEAGDAFLGPWTGKSMADWTLEVRRREKFLLARARELEAAAIAEIEKALPLIAA